MLADRAGIVLETPPSAAAAAAGAVEDRAARGQRLGRGGLRRGAWRESAEALAYLEARGLVARERRAVPPGLCPGRARLAARPGAAGTGSRPSCWSRPGLVVRPDEAPGPVRERFRGRLIFPIHDAQGPDARLRRPDPARSRASDGRGGANMSLNT